MSVKGKSGDKFELLNSYKVSTGKEGVKNPSGSGKISSISLNPTWYPIEDTKMSFKKKGIILPSVVPPNSKYREGWKIIDAKISRPQNAPSFKHTKADRKRHKLSSIKTGELLQQDCMDLETVMDKIKELSYE